jgi:hypothetical protein
MTQRQYLSLLIMSSKLPNKAAGFEHIRCNAYATSLAALPDQLSGAVLVLVLADRPQHLQAPGRLTPLLHHGADLYRFRSGLQYFRKTGLHSLAGQVHIRTSAGQVSILQQDRSTYFSRTGLYTWKRQSQTHSSRTDNNS